uniref:RanBD1 domain-containing protein n=1 Tax=Schistosoma curassoni TaxID=6186 RepID=A0A183KIJ9_9TREM
VERPNNVGDREDQSNSNGNQEIQVGGTRNHRNPLDPNWTAKVRYGRDDAVLQSRRAPYTQGVVLMLFKEARNELIGWQSHGSRIIKASFKTKKEVITMHIIQCYAPANDNNDDIKDQFYERLQSIIEKCPRKDLPF